MRKERRSEDARTDLEEFQSNILGSTFPILIVTFVSTHYCFRKVARENMKSVICGCEADFTSLCVALGVVTPPDLGGCRGTVRNNPVIL